jgi:hypothetical protein
VLRDWLLFFHILSAVIYIGGAVAVTIQATGAGAIPRQFLALADSAGRAIGLGGALTLITGVALVLESDVWTFEMTFVIIGIGGMLLAGAVEGLFSRRRIKAVEAAVEEDPIDTEAVAGSLRQVMLVNAAVLAVLVFVIWAMVFKPGF